MRHASESSRVNVPFKVLPAHSEFADPVLKLLKRPFPLGASDDFANLREEDIHCPDSLSVVILLHVEGLDLLRIACEDDRLLEMLLHKVSLVLALEVNAPIYRILELDSVLCSLLKNPDSLGVLKPYELCSDHAPESLDETVVVFVVEEPYIVNAVLQCPGNQVFDEFLRKVHIVLYIVECHLRLNHPELSKMSRGIGILSPECRAECIDFANGSRSKFAFELSAHGKAGLLPEKILIVVDFALLVPWKRFVKIQSGHLEHLSCTLTVRLSDERCVEINEALFLEECMNRIGHGVPDSEYRSKGVCPHSHVGNRPEILQ